MPRPRNAEVRTPGVPTELTDDQRKAQEDEAEALDQELLAGGDTHAVPEVPAVGLSPDLQALVAREVAKGIAAHRVAERKAAANPVSPSQELPSQHEVDAFAIKKEVLTKDGYVVPHAYPQPHVPQSLR